MSNHTIIAFCISVFVFFIGYSLISQKTDDGLKQYTCTYLKKDICIIPLDNGELEKADISKLDQSKYTSGETVVYKIESPDKQENYGMLVLSCIILFLILRFGHYIFRGLAEAPGSFFD